MRYPYGCISGCTPEFCCSWTSQDCALRSACRIAWTAIQLRLDATVRCSWTSHFPSRLPLDRHRLCAPSMGCTSQAAFWGALLDGFPAFISSSRAPSFSKVRTPRFPLVQGFPTGSFLIRIPLIAPFTFHFLSLRYGKQSLLSKTEV
jgi:hypothetical protein